MLPLSIIYTRELLTRRAAVEDLPKFQNKVYEGSCSHSKHHQIPHEERNVTSMVANPLIVLAGIGRDLPIKLKVLA